MDRIGSVFGGVSLMEMFFITLFMYLFLEHVKEIKKEISTNLSQHDGRVGT